MPMLKPHLNSKQMAVLKPVQGQHAVAALFSRFILNAPRNHGREGTATIGMLTLFADTLDALGNPSGYDVLPDVRWNLNSGSGSGSISGIVAAGLRPAMTIIHNSCTILLGEHKAPDNLQEAATDIKKYAEGGLPSALYGDIPGIPAYAAAGTCLRFLYIKSDGEVCTVGLALWLLGQPGSWQTCLLPAVGVSRIYTAPWLTPLPIVVRRRCSFLSFLNTASVPHAPMLLSLHR